ncbi:MAG: hypothetical protein ACLPSW_29965 [Roseiarcus sp.]
MHPGKRARAAPASAGSDPQIERFGGQLNCQNTEVLSGVQGRDDAVIGVDRGVHGALALLSRAGELLALADMPTLHDGPAGRATVNAPLLADLLARWHASRAYVELVNARPGEGAVGAFSFGRSRGLVEGVLAAFNVPLRFLTPPTWKRVLGLPTGRPGTKDAARSEAIRRWPARAVLFGRVKDDGRAEAALIAVAGMLRGQR